MANRYQHQVDTDRHEDYGRAQQRQVDNDPLRELARLIGQTDPNANFATRESQPRVQQAYVEQQYAEQAYAEPPHASHEPYEAAQEPAAPSWMRTAQTSRHQPPIGGRATPLPQNDYEQEALPLSQPPAFLRARHQHQPAPQDYYEQQQSQDPATRYDDALYGQNPDNVQYQDQQHQHEYQQDGYQDQYAQQYDPNAYQQYAEEEQPQRKRGGMFTVAMVAALAFVGTAGAFAYRSYMGSPRSGEPPVIKAEPGSNKIVPQQTADANKINDRIGSGNTPERVVPREETPVDIARQQPRVVFPPLNQNSNPPSVQSVSTTAAIVAPPAAQANGAVGEEPRRVRTTTIRPNEPATTATQARPNGAPTSARAQMPAGNGPMSISPQSTSSAPVRTAAVAPSTTTGSTGGFVVQISSQRSEADAQASYRAIQAKYPNVLGSRPAMIRRADLGERGIYYRAMVGPFSGAEDASQLCNSLKSAGGACVVQRN